MRRDPSKENTKAYDYVQQAAIRTDENTHGGNDVAIHAVGKLECWNVSCSESEFY